MSIQRIAAIALVAVAGAAPLAAQRSVVFNLNGGGYNHLANLSASGSPVADFKPGYNFGASVGVDLTKWFGVHGDFTFAHATARGASSFSGGDIHRMFYGAHLEARLPLERGFTPFAFLGGGAVTVVQAHGGTLPTFTRPAGMMGLGFGYQVPGSRVEVFGEGKSLVYNWNQAGFNKTQWDVTYAIGLSYRLPLQ